MSASEETNCPNCGAPITSSICKFCGTVFPANIDAFAGKPSLLISFDDNDNVYIRGMYVNTIHETMPELYFSTASDNLMMFDTLLRPDINISAHSCKKDVFYKLLGDLKEKL